MRKKKDVFQFAEAHGQRPVSLETLIPAQEKAAFQAHQDRIGKMSGDAPGKKKRMNTVQAAEYLGLRPNTLEIWRCHKKGPKYIKLGRRVLYDVDDLDAFALACTIEPQNDVTLADLERDRNGGRHETR